jgi:hypothetical protein
VTRATPHPQRARDDVAAADTSPTSRGANTHPVQVLYARVDAFDQYPPGVIRIWELPQDTGFFPGNPGLWNVTRDQPLPRWPLDGVMVVGHNYDCEEGFHRTVLRTRPIAVEQAWPAFRWLRLLLEAAAIGLEDCFYTNFFVGLKAGAQSTGPFPGRHDTRFVNWCRALLLEEIHLQQPTLLLTLGQAVLPFLAPLEPLRAWSGVRSLRQLDEQHNALLPGVQFAECPRPTTVVALTHPGYWPRNVISRRYMSRRNGLLSGRAAEEALLQDGVQDSGYSATLPGTNT